MLEKLKQLLIDEKLIREYTISTIPDSTCSSDIVVIYYDDTKKRFCTKIGIDELPSCDCLFLHMQKNEIYFIEMKRLEIVIRELKVRYTTQHEFEKELEIKLSNLNFSNKIIDSYTLLLSIVGYYDGYKELYSFLHSNIKKNHIKIRFFVLTDLSNEYWNLCFISNPDYLRKKVKYRFLSDSAIIRCEDLPRLLKA